MAIERLTVIAGRALPLRGDHIDTDRIIPARFLRSVSFDGLERHLFEDDIAQAGEHGATHPVVDERYHGASILVVNQNFGCGSSREHAPQALRRRGLRAVVGESFSEIFFGNSAALGLPCVTAPRAEVERLQQAVEADPSLEVRVDLERQDASWGTDRFGITIPAAVRESFLDGSWDATGLLLDRFEEVQAAAARLPYVTGW